MVACPRNQRYLQPLPLRAGVVAGEGQDAGERTGKLDLEFAIHRHQADLVDQSADGGRGLLTQLRPVQLLVQPGNLVAIDLRQIGMQADGRRG